MAYTPGLPTQPVIVFWSGDICLFLQELSVWKYGKKYSRITMVLSDFTKGRYKIKSDQLDYTITSTGAFTRDYPSELLHVVTPNPEYQVYICLANFDGTLVVDTEIQLVKKRTIELKDEIATAWKENEALRDQLKQMAERIRELEIIYQRG